MGKPRKDKKRYRYDFIDDYIDDDLYEEPPPLPDRELADPSAPAETSQEQNEDSFSQPVDSNDISIELHHEAPNYDNLYPGLPAENDYKGARPKTSGSGTNQKTRHPPRPLSPQEVNIYKNIKLNEKKSKLIRDKLNINTQMQENLQAEAANYEDEREVMKVRESLLNEDDVNLQMTRELQRKLAKLQNQENTSNQNQASLLKAVTEIGKFFEEATSHVMERIEKLEQRKLDETEFFSPDSQFDSDRQSTPQPAAARPWAADTGPRVRGRQPRRGSSSPSSSSSSSSSSRSRRSRHSHDRRRRSSSKDSKESRHKKHQKKSRGQGSGHSRRHPGSPPGPDGGPPNFDPMRGGQRHPDKKKKRKNHAGAGGGGSDDPGGGGGGHGGDQSDSSLSSSSNDSDLSYRSQIHHSPVTRLIYKLKMILRKMKRALRNHSNVKMLLEQEIKRGEKISLELDDHVMRLRHVSISDLDRVQRLGDRIDRARVRLTLQVDNLEAERAEASRGARATLPTFNGECTQWTSFEREFRRGVRSYGNDDLRITALRKAIVGQHKDYITSLFLHCDKFETCLKRLADRYGDYAGLLPSETQRIRDLPAAKFPDQENDVILKCRQFISWCVLNGRQDSDFSEMSEIIRSKLLDRSQDMVITNNISKMSEFEALFEKLTSINHKKIIARNRHQGGGHLTAVPRGGGSGAGGQRAPGGGSGGHHPSTGSRYSTQSDIRCDICQEIGHSKFSCAKLKNFSSVSEAKKRIRELGRCLQCLGKYSPGHFCSENYFSKKLQREVPRACRCGSKINGAVCPCDKGRGSRGGAGGGAQLNPQLRDPGTGGGTHHPPPTGPGPVTVTRSARVSFPKNFVRMNNTLLSFSLTICQQMYLVAPNGYRHLFLVIFDNGSENCQISESLRIYSHRDSPAKFNVKTIGHSYQKETGLGKFVLQSPFFPECQWSIDALYNDLTAIELSSRSIPIPEKWQREHGLSSLVASPQGPGVIIIGSDLLAQCHPVVKDTHGSLVLLQSRLDNSYILGGCISEADIQKTDLHKVPTTPHSYVNRIAVQNTNSLDINTHEKRDHLDKMPPLIDEEEDESDTELVGEDKESQIRRTGGQPLPGPEPPERGREAQAEGAHGIIDGWSNSHPGDQARGALDPGGGQLRRHPGEGAEGRGVGLAAGDISAIKVNLADRDWIKLMAGEQGGLLPLICKKCRSRTCEECESMLNLSPATGYENEILASCLSLNEQNRWVVNGKYNGKLREVPDNYQATLEFQKRLEKKLMLNPALMQSFNENIQRRIDSGMFIRLSDLVAKHGEDILKMKICWSPTNFIRKLNSTSNKTRAVFNQSFKSDPTKSSLNESRFKGSSYNRNIQHILLRSRNFYAFSMGDILDFYNQIGYENVRDILLNSFIWKEGGYGTDGDWITISSAVVNFGQRDSQNLANLAKLLSSEKYVKPDSENAHEQTGWSLSDDFGVGGDNRKEVDEVINIVTPNLGKVGFKFKSWIHSGDRGKATVMGQKGVNSDTVLGIVWLTEEDCYSIPIAINLSPKKRGLRSPEFEINSEEDMREFLKKYKLNKRSLARFCACVYDPLMLLGHLRCMLTLLFHRAIQLTPGLRWEDEVSSEIHEDMIHCVRIMLQCKDIKVPRFVCAGIIGKDVMCCAVVDGSQILAAARIFLRYKTSDNTWDSNYLCGSILLNDTGNQSPTKCEVLSLLMGTKLMMIVNATMTNLNITEYLLLSDSEVALSGVVSTTAQQRLFYAQRNYEARSYIEKLNIQLYKVDTKLNDADCYTKMPKGKYNAALDRVYWKSHFLFERFELWPVTRYEYSPLHLSQEVLNPAMTVSSFRAGIKPSDLEIEIIIRRFGHSFKKMSKCLSYLFLFLKNQTLFSAQEKAKLFLLKSVDISEESLTGIKRQFNLIKMDELYYVLPRTMMVQGNPLQEKLILCDIKSQVGRAVLNDAHIHVCGLGPQESKMYQNKIYVIGHRRYFRRMQQSCYTCRKIRKLQLSSLMGSSWQLQGARNCPPMTVVFADPVGYFRLIKEDGTIGKIWFLTVSCLVSRYTLYLVLETMTSDSILRALRIAGWMTGNTQVRIVHCDRGSNLLPLLQFENETNGDQEEIKVFDNLRRTLHKNGIVLKPAVSKSPWRLALVEKCQHLFKIALKRCGYYHKKFTLGQWTYIAHKMASHVNSRALNVSYQADGFTIISPAALLFGLRKADFPRDINLDYRDENLFKNVKKLDKELLLLENAWYKSYYHSLRKWRKWHVKKTLEEEDIVMILDKITPQGTPQLGIVSKVHSDRSYEITYVYKEAKIDKNTFQITKSAKKGTLDRPINQLAIVCKKNECTNINLEFVDTDTTKPHGPEFEDEFLGEDETFNDVNIERDQITKNLDDMIVGHQPSEVIDEIYTEGTNNEEIVVDEKADVTDIVQGDQDIVQGDDRVGADVADIAQDAEPQEAQGNHNETSLGTPVEDQKENTINAVNKVKARKPVIVTVEDEPIEEIVDLEIPASTNTSTKTRGRPKGKKGRKRMNW